MNDLPRPFVTLIQVSGIKRAPSYLLQGHLNSLNSLNSLLNIIMYI